jgi:hypothetical protein
MIDVSAGSALVGVALAALAFATVAAMVLVAIRGDTHS